MTQQAYILTTRASYNAMMAAYAARDLEAENDPNKDVWWQIERGAVQQGYWKDQPGDIINLHLIGSEAEIQSVIDYLGAGVSSTYWWDYGGTVIVDKEVAGQHDEILMLHNDHVEYGEDGNETSRESASFDNPNWAHGFAGQGELVNQLYGVDEIQTFARSVSRGFSNGVG